MSQTRQRSQMGVFPSHPRLTLFNQKRMVQGQDNFSSEKTPGYNKILQRGVNKSFNKKIYA